MYATVGATVDDDWRRIAKQQIEARLGIDLFGWVAQADAEAGTLAACAFANLNARLPLPGARGPWRAYVQWVSVDPAAQRQGWASALMVELERWAKERQVDVLELHSSPAGRALYQGLGYGHTALAMLIEYVRALPGATELLLSYVPEAGSPEPFYRSLGFKDTGEIHDDEHVMRYEFSPETSV